MGVTDEAPKPLMTGAEMEERLELCPVCGRKSVAATAAKMRGIEYDGSGCPLLRYKAVTKP